MRLCTSMFLICCFFFFFKQKTAYELRMSDWSSDVCSSDLKGFRLVGDDDEAHQCMWAAAIFRALPRINAGLVRLYSHDIASAGDHVQLAREPRYPEAVNDIGGFQLQRDRLADRYVKLIGIEH